MGVLTKWQLQRQLSEKRNNLSTYTKRREQVQAVITNLDGAFGDNVDKVNKKISSCASYLSGLTGVSVVNTARSSLSGKKEKYNDGKLSSCRDSLVSERRRLNIKIEALEGEISRLKNKIANADD